MIEKQYKNIKEVSKILNLKEHVIRYWDSIDPKTEKIRIQGLSTRNRSGTRYFNKGNINKLEQLKSVLFENGKHIYSLDLANKIVGVAGPLTSRVWVNRVWGWHFGEHLVRTPSDFGVQGQKPTHPQLLKELSKTSQNLQCCF